MHDMRQSVKLTSIAHVVKAFGGTDGMAEWAGIGPSAVSNWIARDHIPPGWHLRMYREAAARGFEIDESVFDDRLRDEKKKRRASSRVAA
jgi:hypothetical protein